MGIGNSFCCTRDSSTIKTEYEVPIDDKEMFSERKLKSETFLPNVPISANATQCFDFILSSAYYKLLTAGIPHFHILYKLTVKLSNSDLITLLNKLIDWSEISDHQLIKETKSNLQIGTKNILLDFNAEKNTYSNNKNFKHLLCKGIAEISLIVQYIKYLNENQTDPNYEVFLWKGKEIEREMMMNSYNAIYYLVKAKLSVKGEAELGECSQKILHNVNKLLNEISETLIK